MNVRRTLALLLLCIAAVAPMAYAASPNVVISQVYGGGGATTGSPAYLNDYVELFNSSNTAVAIGGWSLQYGSSTGQFASSSSNLYAIPAGTTIGAGKYLTVKLGAAGTLGGSFTADLTTTNLSMSAGSGKVALANINTALGCGASATPCALPDSRIVDLVAWGASNNGEGNTTVNSGTGLNSSQGGIRKSDGCQDTDSNSADFLVATTATGLVPRTVSTPAHSCGSGDLPPSITAPSNPAATVLQDAAPFTVGLTGADDNSVYNWSATAGSGVSAVNVTGGQGTANVTYTVTLVAGFSGTASFTASLSDNANTPATTQVVNISVTPLVANDPPTINTPANPIATVDQDAAPFTVSLSGLDDDGIYNWSATTGTGVSAVSVASGQGTDSVTYQVTLQPGYSGTASFTARLSDNVNPNVLQAVNITVTPAPPPPLDHLVISQIYGGGGNTGATYLHDYVELYNPTLSAVDTGGWTVQYGATGGSTWQVQPLGGIIQPGEYYLIRLATGTAGAGATVPAANVNGDINMAAANGKVALVRGGDALDGACPLSDPLLVDLVGFGTANCREGATNAPAGTNILAIFRKNGGFTDTNVNGADFQTGAPNPRRTAVITEIGPYVLTVDPRNNNTFAPRDLSVTVTFTETVDLDSNWFNIDCTVTGPHNDATIAHSGRIWVITPNVNFQPTETCTVTIDKDLVHDTDLDDSAPNTDTLVADYSWSFSIATGTAPVYASDVHLTMGNPSDAENDLLMPNNYLMVKPEYTLSYNRERGTPNWVSWHLADEWVGTLSRVDTFRADPEVPADWYRVTQLDYFATGFDRGHMVPNADRDKETSVPINQATFLMSNMIPQSPNNNQGPWADLENYLRTLVPANELYIVAGGSGIGGNSGSGVVNTIANGNITVPSHTWKVVLVLPKDSGDDVSRATAATRTIAVRMPNVQGIFNDDWTLYLTTVDAVEQVTGYDFFENVSDAVENAIEAGTNGVNPPGVASQSFNTDEDQSEEFTLVAASANPGSLTYTIVSGPSHGSLSGSGATQTYTPAPDYYGTDSFTFQATDANGTSNTATMSITVYPVDDAPVIGTVTGPTSSLTLGTSATVSVTYTDADPTDTHTAAFTWDDGTSTPVSCSAGVCSANHTFGAAGVYTVSIVVTDDDGLTDSAVFQHVIVTSASAGFVNGGGWVDTAAGKGQFEVSAKYLKGAATPTGSTTFAVAGSSFASTSYEWLVVSGSNAQVQGTGTINGAGSYGFLMTASDASPDKFRIRIWETSSGTTVFDNVMGAPDDIDLASPQALGGGKIQVLAK
jgi:endonuclease G